MGPRAILLSGILVFTAGAAPTSAVSLANASAEEPDAAVPAVSFTLDFPGSRPSHYSIVVDSSGKATYSSGPSSAKPANAATAVKHGQESDSDSDSPPDSDAPADTEEPFHYDFTVSDATRARIFDLAERARYFESNLNYNKHNLANTGDKTLAYHDAGRNSHSTFNYTTNQPAQQLTALFQDISSTMEYGHRLTYQYQYQKLALDQEMKSLENASRQSNLEELQAIAPILKRIIADSSVINVTRARAERLLAKVGISPR